AIASLFPGFICFLMTTNDYLALSALMLIVIVSNFMFAPAFAILQRLFTVDMRATALALVMLIVNLVGMGLGPQLVGILSDAFRSSAGEDSLRPAMLSMSLLSFWASYHFWLAGNTVSN